MKAESASISELEKKANQLKKLVANTSSKLVKNCSGYPAAKQALALKKQQVKELCTKRVKLEILIEKFLERANEELVRARRARGKVGCCASWWGARELGEFRSDSPLTCSQRVKAPHK